MNPKKALEYYSRVYPAAWKSVDKFRADRGKDLPFWPEWCFMPLAGAYTIVSQKAESQGIEIAGVDGPPLVNDVGVIGALAAWRVTQGVYRFDPDVYQAVIDTPITGDLPHEVLFNLPEWCIYIETPGLKFFNRPTAGFFAHLEYDANDGRKELRLVIDQTKEGEHPVLRSNMLHLGPWPLLESVEKAMQEAERIAKDMIGPKAPTFSPGVAEHVHGDYASMVSLLLYICSVNGEIGDGDRKPVRPRSKKTKKGLRMFPPQQVSVWDVGIRMGATLRRAREYTPTGSPGTGGTKEKSRPRSHVRRAHWHGYWTGPRDGEQMFVLKWLSPILIGAVDDLPVTIRPIK